MTATKYAVFMTNEVLVMNGLLYGAAYGDIVNTGAGIIQIKLRGQRTGRADHIIESFQPDLGHVMYVFWRAGSNDNFTFLGVAQSFVIDRHHEDVGRAVEVDEMAQYTIRVIKKETVVQCPKKLDGDAGPGCSK